MDFIVETGEGLSNATSYVSVQEADDYINSFVVGGAEWLALTISEKEKSLMQATRFLDTMMGWQGHLKEIKQSLAWPRVGVIDREGRLVPDDRVPAAIKDAQVELAVSSLATSLTTSSEKLIRESFADTEDWYAAPVSRGGNEVVQSLLKSLAFLGYGRSKATVVTIHRS